MSVSTWLMVVGIAFLFGGKVEQLAAAGESRPDGPALIWIALYLVVFVCTLFLFLYQLIGWVADAAHRFF